MIQHIPDIPADDASRIVKRPDGYYWVDSGNGVEFGPFATAELALADMESNAGSDYDYEPGASLEEAEAELGIADWIDTDTGAPAEDSVPRLDD